MTTPIAPRLRGVLGMHWARGNGVFDLAMNRMDLADRVRGLSTRCANSDSVSNPGKSAWQKRGTAVLRPPGPGPDSIGWPAIGRRQSAAVRRGSPRYSC
jgi:hypothetical protein